MQTQFTVFTIIKIAIENNQKIIETFKAAKKPLKAGEVAELSGIDKKEVEKLIKKMTLGGELYSPMRCFYDIKK